jgi:ABC-type dipeptide/oligopeptide/nickel transport system permease component
MLAFIARRFGQAVLALLGSTFLMYFAVFRLGDPFKWRGEKLLPPDTQVMLKAHFGLDKPMFEQYLIYLKNIVTLDFGVDFTTRKPVADLLAAAAPNTLRLTTLAIIIDVLIGVLAGIAAAVWKDTFIDALVSVSTILILCVPLFVIAFVLRTTLTGVHVLGIEIFPQLPPPFGVEVPWYRKILLPAISLALMDIAFMARLMRASMIEVLGQPYLNTARGKGLPERTIIFRHAARNALRPVVTHIGILFGLLMGGAIIVEFVFSYPGLGLPFVGALGGPNIPILLAIAVLSLITFVTLSAIVDVFAAYLDPRIRV